MILEKKRIRSLNSLSFIKNNQVVRFGVSKINRFNDICMEIGFTPNLSFGETVIPDKIGPVSTRNAEGQYIPQKDQEKETVYYPREWTRKQWVGKGDTEEVTDTVYIPIQRYPRKFVLPQSVELTIAKNRQNEKVILSSPIQFNESNESIIIHTVNLILEIFGECEAFEENLDQITVPEIRRLSWEVLPQGDYPWKKLKENIEPFIDKAKKGNRAVIYNRLEKLNSYKPNLRLMAMQVFQGI